MTGRTWLVALLAGIVWVAALGALALPTEADGCASISRKEDHVRIAEESAVIVWDAPSQTQHFIRRATFNTQAKDFGFLVPTPTQPAKMVEIADSAFSFLEDATRPKVIEVRGEVDYTPLLLCCCFMFGGGAAAPEKKDTGVRVLDAQRVGGLDAVVVEADNARALNDWLKEQGYPSDPELVSWLEPYVTKKWKITAFKIAPDDKASGHVQTSAVRMSFKTDRPFFPYREPKEQDDPKFRPFGQRSRMLRVFFLSNARTTGKRGDGDWSVRVPWAGKLDDEQRATLVTELSVPAEHLPAGTWLTTLEDAASPRPGTDDVYFEPAPHQSAVRPPSIVHRGKSTRIPLDVVSLLVMLLGVIAVFSMYACLWWKRRRRRGPLDKDDASSAPVP